MEEGVLFIQEEEEIAQNKSKGFVLNSQIFPAFQDMLY
jgi:hypothetical protein